MIPRDPTRRRVNTINGRTYSEDPTIMAWNLINEPRCYRCAPALQARPLRAKASYAHIVTGRAKSQAFPSPDIPGQRSPSSSAIKQKSSVIPSILGILVSVFARNQFSIVGETCVHILIGKGIRWMQ